MDEESHAKLARVQRMVVLQKREDMEICLRMFDCCSWCNELRNNYHVYAEDGSILYHAKETSGCCARNCCGSMNPFKLELYAGLTKDLKFRLKRECRLPCAPVCCCFPCCRDELNVYSANDVLLGSIQELDCCGCQRFLVKGSQEDFRIEIRTPTCFRIRCCCACMCDQTFRVVSNDQEVGELTRHYRGLASTLISDADQYSINFPVDLDAQYKLLLLAATFLIDYRYFEKDGALNK